MNSLFDNSLAFSPFFDAAVTVVLKREGRVIRTACKASVMQAAKDEPFGETLAESDRLRYNIAIPEKGEGGFNRRERLQAGDEITLESGEKLAVTAALIGADGFIEVEARSVK